MNADHVLTTCLIGGGNITNLRHVPALKKVGRSTIIGVIGHDPAALQRTSDRLPRAVAAVLVDSSRPMDEQLTKIRWFKSADTVVVGTPPRTHYEIAMACLRLGKSVLLEKPMTMAPAEAELLASTAADHGTVLAVMHNFQFASGIQKLARLSQRGELGEITSAAMVQLTNRTRRLPRWYRDLPLGLFYDEASHFFYITRRFLGPTLLRSATSIPSTLPDDNTPAILSADLVAGDVPAHMFINFQSPICEWAFLLFGTKRLAVYDFFRDILISLPNDGEHRAPSIVRTSLTSSVQHWRGTVFSGTRLLRGQLLYGVDHVIANFFDAVLGAPLDPLISTDAGIETVKSMHEVIGRSSRGERPLE